MDATLSTYPLSQGFDRTVQAVLGREYLRLSAAELRQRPFFSMLRYLRSLSIDRLVFPIEDSESLALLPVLQTLGAAVPARETYVLDDSRLRRVTPADMLKAAAGLGYASLAYRRDVASARRDVPALLQADRVAARSRGGRDLTYINANLWFGVKAGGSVGHISGVINAFLDDGFEVDFFSAGGRLLVRDRARYEQLHPPALFGFPPEINHYRFNALTQSQIAGSAALDRADFIYQRLSTANYAGVAVSRSRNLPLVLEYNGSEAWIAKNWGKPFKEQVLAEQIEDANLRHAHLVVTVSDVLRDELLERGIAPDRIVSYPNCIDPSLFDPERIPPEQVAEVRRRHAIPEDAVVVTFIGTFGQWHGVEVLAQAIRQMIDDHSAWLETNKVRFLLVGDGLKMAQVKEILGRHASGPFVRLPGLVEQRQAPLYLAASDILSSPHVRNSDGTRFFGSPTKLFEYMAMGKPVVASDLEQIGEVLRDSLRAGALPVGGESAGTALAILGEPGSVDDQVRGIRFLVDRPDWRARLGANARAEALGKYTWRDHVHAILDGLKAVPD